MTADRITDALTLLAGAEETYEGAPADTNIARAQVLATIAVAEQLAKLTQLLMRGVGHPRLTFSRNGDPMTWAEVTRDYGPLTLIERAGCRRTETTVPVWQLKIGQVVSHPDWCDGAPVRFFGALGDVRDLEITCRPLGWISKITVPAACDAEATLWDEIAGGTR